MEKESSVVMSLEGSDSSGWVWSVSIDGELLLQTERLATDDLGEALFSIRRDPSRVNEHLSEVSDDLLYSVLDGFFSGALYDALRTSAKEQVWARHRVSPPVSLKLQARMYLVGNMDGTERLLVSHGGRLRSYQLRSGNFDEQLDAVIEELDRNG